MSGAFSVIEGGVGAVWTVDGVGNTVQSGNLACLGTLTAGAIAVGTNLTAAGTLTGGQAAVTGALTAGAVVVNGPLTVNSPGTTFLSYTNVYGILTLESGCGVDTAPAATYLATLGIGQTGASGTQLSDLIRDYMVYAVTTTGGAAGNTLTIGSTSAASSATVYACATIGTGVMISYRLPAGWYSRWQGTAATLGIQNAVSC